jgi:hypothetical protein
MTKKSNEIEHIETATAPGEPEHHAAEQLLDQHQKADPTKEPGGNGEAPKEASATSSKPGASDDKASPSTDREQAVEPPTKPADAPAVTVAKAGSLNNPGPKARYPAGKRGFSHWVGRGKNAGFELLTNFVATISEEVLVIDGLNRPERSYVLLVGSDQVPSTTVKVSASEFDSMGWIAVELGARAWLAAGQGNKDKARFAIQLHSPAPSLRKIYKHTGWLQRDDGTWVYLHRGGAITANGNDRTQAVELDGVLESFDLPLPVDDKQAKECVRASLHFLDLAPDRVTLPLYAAIWRAPLGNSDFSIHLSGQTGCFKTTIATLAQQHFGARFGDKGLAAWFSTANYMEGLAFLAKDALLFFDDFVPGGKQAERQAARFFRSAGNKSGRGRMRGNASLRKTQYPRCLPGSTGEALPQGHSVQARIYTIDLEKGEVNRDFLTRSQEIARAGASARAMGAYVRWLAADYEGHLDRFQTRVLKLREEATQDDQHGRTPDIVANLAAGLGLFVDFATELGALSAEEGDELRERAWATLLAGAADQTKEQKTEDPVLRYFELIRAALATGKAYVYDETGQGTCANSLGKAPPNPTRWGWTLVGSRSRAQPTRAVNAEKIGWLKEEGGQLHLYLEPHAAYQIASKMARDEDQALGTSKGTLHKRLKERGYLLTREAARQTLTVRRNLEAATRTVLDLDAKRFLAEGPDGKIDTATGRASAEQAPTGCEASATESEEQEGAKREARRKADVLAVRDRLTEKAQDFASRAWDVDEEVQ